LKVAQDRQKSYADKEKTHKEFKVGDHVISELSLREVPLEWELVPS
jgi:hypothetical protein